MKRILNIIIMISFICGCEHETEWKIKPDQSILIADCIITNEFKRHEVYLYWSSDSLNQPVTGYSGAVIEVSDGINYYSFSEDVTNRGKYYSNVAFRATAERNYRLTISYEGNSDTAYASMTGVSPLEEAIILPEGDYFRYVVNTTSAGYMLELFYDWSEVPDYCEQYGACNALDVYYLLNNIDLGKIFSPDRQVIMFPHKTTIIRRKYSLTPEHQEFARSLMLETEWRGGVFDAEAGNVPTNFKNGMHGWFAVCTMVSDTIQVN